MPDLDPPGRKLTPAEYLTRQVQEHLTGDAFRAQLYDIVRHVLSAQGHNLTLEDVRAVAREEAHGPGGGGGLTGDDVAAFVRASVLSDHPTDVGGAMDAKLETAVGRVTQRTDARLAAMADELEEQLLAAIARRPAAPAEAPRADARPVQASDALLQDIYRAVREEVATLRKTLTREAREAAAAEAVRLAADQPPPLTADDVRVLAVRIVAENEEVHPPRLTEEVVQRLVRAELQAAEVLAPPRLDADSVRGLAAEVVDDALERRPPPLTPHDVRVIADEAAAEAAARGPAPLTREDVAALVRDAVAREVAAQGDASRPSGLDEQAVRAIVIEQLDVAPQAPAAAVDADAVRALVAEAIAEVALGDSGLDADAVRAIVREALAGAPAGGGGPDADTVQAWVRAALAEAEARRPRALTLDDAHALVQKMVAAKPTRAVDPEALRAAVRAELDAVWAQGAPDAAAMALKELIDAALAGRPDALAVRTLARTELAEVLAELPHPHSDEEIGALATEAARRALAERQESGDASVTPADVRRLVREVLAAEGATREELRKLAARHEPAAAVPAAEIERAVQQQVAAVMSELGAPAVPSPEEFGQLVRTEVDEAVRALRESLPAPGGTDGAPPAAVAGEVQAEIERRGLVSAADVQGLVRQMVATQGAGLGAAELKRFIREIVEATSPTHEEVKKMLSRVGAPSRRMA